VDLDNLNGSARHRVIRNIKHACQQYGVFQVLLLSTSLKIYYIND